LSIKPTYEGLSDAVKSITPDFEERIKCAVNASNLSVPEMRNLNLYVQERIVMLTRGSNNLKNYGDDYNDWYSVADNKYIGKAAVMLRKLHSGTVGLRTVFQKLSPYKHLHSKVYDNHGVSPSPWVSSYCSSLYPVQTSLYPVQQFVPEAEELTNSIRLFFKLLEESFKYCIQKLRDEKTIGGNVFLCKSAFYHDRAQAETIRQVMQMKKELMEFDPDQSPVLTARLNEPDFNTFVQKYFHKFTPHELICYFVAEFLGICKSLECSNSELQKDIELEDLTPEETALFCASSNKEKVAKVHLLRDVVSKLDEFAEQPKKGIKKKVSGKTMASIMTYFQPLCKKDFHDYVKKHYKGHLSIPEYQTVNECFASINKKSDTYKQIEERIDQMKPSMPSARVIGM
jgi:hypothetical protein